MKDFDVERKTREEVDRSFVLAGETFTHRIAVAPEAIVRWNEAVTTEVTLTEAQWLDLYDETIVSMLEPGEKEKWERIRQPEVEHPVTLSDMREVLKFVMGRVTGRPTTEPSGSSNGSDPTGTSLKDDSSSREPVSTA